MIEDTSRKLYCANHPNRETLLRCNRCERPICVDCAILTETGYRCKDCVRGQQKIFETAQWLDYPLGIAVAAVLAFIGSILASFLGFFTLFLAPMAGVIIAEGVRWVTKKRRSRWLYRATTLAAVAGALVLPLVSVVSYILGIRGLAIWSLIWQVAYVILVASTVYYRLSGIRIR